MQDYQGLCQVSVTEDRWSEHPAGDTAEHHPGIWPLWELPSNSVLHLKCCSCCNGAFLFLCCQILKHQFWSGNNTLRFSAPPNCKSHAICYPKNNIYLLCLMEEGNAHFAWPSEKQELVELAKETFWLCTEQN